MDFEALIKKMRDAIKENDFEAYYEAYAKIEVMGMKDKMKEVMKND